MNDVSPLLAGLTCRCPSCGKGKLYRGYLHLVETCSDCSARISDAEVEDPPVTFMLILVGGLGLLAVAICIVQYHLPTWLVGVICVPLTLILSLAVLPPCKAFLVALQYQYKTRELSADHLEREEEQDARGV